MPIDLRTRLGRMAAGVAVAFTLRRNRVENFWFYIVGGGALAWFGLYQGGLHAALALVPVIPFLPRARRDPGLFVEAPVTARDTLSEFEHWWKYPVQGILFFFGLVNAGVPLGAAGHGTWAVLTAILVGKPLGIAIAVAIAVAVGLKLPSRLDGRDVIVTGCAAGIGFTVALFFATAAFPAGRLLDASSSISAGNLLIFAEADGEQPLPFPLEVDGQKVEGHGTVLYQISVPLPRDDQRATTRPSAVESTSGPVPQVNAEAVAWR
jgi:NhaA family Na+:H+ antiporter